MVRFRRSLAPVLTVASSSANPPTNARVDIAGVDVTVVGVLSGKTYVTTRLNGRLEVVPSVMGQLDQLRGAAWGGVDSATVVLISSTIGVTDLQITVLNALLAAQLNKSMFFQTLDSVQLPSFQGLNPRAGRGRAGCGIHQPVREPDAVSSWPPWRGPKRGTSALVESSATRFGVARRPSPKAGVGTTD